LTCRLGPDPGHRVKKNSKLR